MRSLLVLLAVLWVCDAVKFGQLCSGNPSNSRRTSDRWGQGQYGAGRYSEITFLLYGWCERCDTAAHSWMSAGFRGTRLHQGLDIKCSDGAAVYAPFDVTLNGKLTVYTDPTKAAINEGINLSGQGLCFKLFYVRPDRTSGTVRKGQRIGTMLPMQSVYPGITSHVHVQMCDKSDPTPYF
uniref:Leukocyte cell-derived chemotaxin 2 like n=1 Tax=Oreochromis aureus TaxID=47969 RepID=A0AAZ1XJF7_OREAU